MKYIIDEGQLLKVWNKEQAGQILSHAKLVKPIHIFKSANDYEELLINTKRYGFYGKDVIVYIGVRGNR